MRNQVETQQKLYTKTEKEKNKIKVNIAALIAAAYEHSWPSHGKIIKEQTIRQEAEQV